MKTPHKYAELIKAWADGAEIQVYSDHCNEWVNYSEGEYPSWGDEYKYRIKPEPKPDMVLHYRVNNYEFNCVPAKIVWTGSNGANLKLTFDGETGKLKSAEVL